MIHAVCTAQTFQGVKSGISAFPEISTKIIGWVTKYFGLTENLFFLSYGGKELLIDGVLAKRNMKPLDSDATGIQKRINKIKSVTADLFQAHGKLYIGSAIAGTAVELHHMQTINLGSLTPAISFVGTGLFLYASLLSLAFHVDLYQKAKEFEENGMVKTVVNSLKASSIMGIINSLGYVMAAVATLAGGGVALPLIFGCFALATGCIKVLYDYFILPTKLNSSYL